MRTLIIIDVQNDFMSDGALPVPHGEDIVPIINSVMEHFELIVASMDWHPQNHKSFAANHVNRKPYDHININGMDQILWPNHCVWGSIGAQFHPQLNTSRIETIFRKGVDPDIDSYSCFYDNLHQKSTGLVGYLSEKKSTKLYFCGLCADICVYFSIKDAIDAGFSCCLIEDATMPLRKDDFAVLKKELTQLGVEIISSKDIKQKL